MPAKSRRVQPDWMFTDKRKAALAKAQRTHVMLVRIGKRYLPQAIKDKRRIIK